MIVPASQMSLLEPNTEKRYCVKIGDMLQVVKEFPDCHFDAVLCDPPYHLTQNSRNGSPRSDGGKKTPFGRHGVGTDKGFMGQTWDGGDVAFRPETWDEIMRVMKPGAYLMAFGGTRTFHWMMVAMEDAGLTIMDTMMYLHGTGFPKSLNISKEIDRKFGLKRTISGDPYQPPDMEGPWNLARASDERLVNVFASHRNLERMEPASEEAKAWDDYGSALKPAYEPIILCRKQGEKTYAENALRWGCGGLNIGGGRIPVGEEPISVGSGNRLLSHIRDGKESSVKRPMPETLDSGSHPGRWPANVILDEESAAMLNVQTGIRKSGVMKSGTIRSRRKGQAFGEFPPVVKNGTTGSTGGVSRFFYTSKVSTKERNMGMPDGLVNEHPTMKPIDLTRHLATLLLPPSRSPEDAPRRLLVPFSGVGSEMIGALLAGWDEVIGIEQRLDYAEIAEKRIAAWVDVHGQNLHGE